MNDDTTELTGELIDIVPSIGWVVHEVARPKDASPVVWAWCRVSVDGPGYSEVTFTLPDGSTSTDIGSDTLVLGPVLFQLWC